MFAVKMCNSRELSFQRIDFPRLPVARFKPTTVDSKQLLVSVTVKERGRTEITKMRVPGTGSTGRYVSSVLDYVECGMWNVECGMWNVECGMWNIGRTR